ncbi:hypothetical protein [Bacteroides thetaiotaomicron]|uniref:hypothetical protein n=1 Tax=Bacteroides thetaiotaomicron TaxID=818 RepID=UPI0039C27464
MMEQENARSLFDVFAASQETFEDAKKKSSEESSKRASFFRFAKDGTYAIRILPLAPVQDKDGNFLPLERKGYEYPLRSLMLKIENDKNLSKESLPLPMSQFATPSMLLRTLTRTSLTHTFQSLVKSMPMTTNFARNYVKAASPVGLNGILVAVCILSISIIRATASKFSSFLFHSTRTWKNAS